MTAFLDLNWSDEWTSTVGFSYQDNDLPNGQSDSAFAKRHLRAREPALASAAQCRCVGAEMQYAERENFLRRLSRQTMFRIQFSAKVQFPGCYFGGNKQ